MVMARAWYVHGKKLAFPYGERLVSGPFDEHGGAFDEAARLRPFYPDATLSARPHRAKSLPVRTPRTRPPGDDEPEHAGAGYDLSRVEQRRAAAEALRVFVVDRLGLACTVEDWEGEPDVDCRAPGLLGHIWLGWTRAAPMPIISWVADDPRQLVAVLPGAWRETHPHRKATSSPATWARLFDALEIGLLAAIDGSAFE